MYCVLAIIYNCKILLTPLCHLQVWSLSWSSSDEHVFLQSSLVNWLIHRYILPVRYMYLCMSTYIKNNHCRIFSHVCVFSQISKQKCLKFSCVVWKDNTVILCTFILANKVILWFFTGNVNTRFGINFDPQFDRSPGKQFASLRLLSRSCVSFTLFDLTLL